MKKTKKNNRPICYQIFSWLMTAFMLWSFGSALMAADSFKTDTVELAGAGWTKERISQIRTEEKEQEEEASFTAWKEKSGAILENQEWNRQATVSALELNGDSSLVLPEGEKNQLPAEDTEGCLLDWKTAESLFGNQEVDGCHLQYEGRELIVRGVLKSGEGLIVVQSKEDSQGVSFTNEMDSSPIEEGFDRISLKVSSGKEKEQEAEDFLNRHGLEGTMVRTDWSRSIGSFFSLLLPLLLFIKIIKEYGSLLLRYREFPVVFMAGIIGTGLLLWAFAKMQGLSFTIPESMIPTRWSDFTFWQPWMEEKKAQYALVTSISKSVFQVEQSRKLLWTAECGIAAVICLPFSILKEQSWGKKEMLAVLVLSWIVFYLLILQYQQAGEILAEKKGMWFLLPIYMLLISLKKWAEKEVKSKLFCSYYGSEERKTGEKFFSKNSKLEA